MHHTFDVRLRQIGRSRDFDGLFSAGSKVLGAYMNDAVRVNVECDLDLWHATWCGRNTLQPESRQGRIVTRHWSFALCHVNVNCGLAVLCGAENLALSRGNRRVPCNYNHMPTTESLDPERKRSDVQKN